mgnify:CR=1 FL=1
MKYDLTVSVVLFNTDVNEINSIENIILASKLETKLFFIDNSPTKELEKHISNVEQIEYAYTGKNLGFGAAHNMAIAKAKNIADFHLVLNADVVFEAEILADMISFMRERTNVGLMAPKVLNPDGTIQYTAKLLPSPANLIFRRFSPLKSIVDKLDYRYELKSFGFNKIIEAPFFMGCFLLINTKVFDKVSGFDDRFFMYTEDIDLVRRIHAHYKTLYYPNVSIVHEHGKGSYKNKKLLKYHINAAITYFNKWGWFFDKERKTINKKILEQFY